MQKDNNKMTDDCGRTLITADEVADLLGIRPASVYYHRSRQHICADRRMYYEDTALIYKNSKESKINPYGNLDLAFDEVCKPLLSLHYQDYAAPFYYANKKYLVTSHGRVWDLTNNTEVQPTKNNGYLRASILFRGFTRLVYVHRLVGMMFCPNGRHVECIHHIDTIKTNNRADNLLWCTPAEHKHLHQLREQGNNKEYKAEVKRIRRSNEITVPYKYLVSNQTDKGMIFLMVTVPAYNRIINNGDSIDSLDASEILMEFWLSVPAAMRK